MPVPVSPNAELTNEGVRLIGDTLKPGQPFRVTSAEDVRNILPYLQTRIVAAVASMLPGPSDDGREAWSVVNDCLSRFCRSDNGEDVIEEAVPFLLACRLLMKDGPRDDEQKVLAVFVDRYLPFARGERISDLLPKRAPTIYDVYRDLNGGDVDTDYVKGVSLPWPGTLGADLAPFASVGDALDFFDRSDLIVERERVAISVGRQGGRLEVEIRMSEDGLRDAQELVAEARKSIGQPSGDDSTPAGTIAGEIDGFYQCAVASGYDRFRVHVNPMPDRSAYWVFRRLYVPKAPPKLNFGFDVA
ncbi:hypothetical protein OIU34_20200 [Pararhizobium sp. BT-229]|uniref:hypothetical protein n=1 Tax=Pararhizobium sp. BT-229 TaxID=2986923 RepID=UPI0021F77ADE|nr:hypothetical protein [Pararhizobium sp. BT-229]MCV9964210.1 hypothetical protein [Pararhizobium sp. BT-229]